LTRIDLTPPEIDYLAKDYASFRRLMLDHLSHLVPDWKEQNEADLGQVLVEVLAYAADYLSYYQDAVATEAYLGTARLRRSVQRHARLLEYFLEEGCNARAWVQIRVKDRKFLPIHTQLLTRLENIGTVVSSNDAVYHQALQDGVPVFETMHPIYLMPHHNQIPLLARNQERYLPRGSTSARLRYTWAGRKASEKLKVGDVLIFEQRFDLQTGMEVRNHCHAVRLTGILPNQDRKETWIDIEWAAADALPFDLCIGSCAAEDPGSWPSFASGNIVLADHGQQVQYKNADGRTTHYEELPAVPSAERYRPCLRFPDLTFSVPFDPLEARKLPAWQAMQYRPYEAIGWVRLHQYPANFATHENYARHLLQGVEDQDQLTLGDTGSQPVMMMRYNWTPRRDLLNSGPFDRDFQVEMEEDRRAYLRFGLEGRGKTPNPGDRFVAIYRIGNGSQGNVGAEAIAHIVDEQPELIEGVRNPMPARGGCDPETIQSARLHAPYVYRTRKGCVTPSDYAEQVREHPQVVDALVHTRLNGNRRTILICVRRRNDLPVDQAFQQELQDFLEPCRLIGHDIEIEGPGYVPARVKLCIGLKPHASSAIVQEELRKAFQDHLQSGSKELAYDPRSPGFGQALHQSQIITWAMAVRGVERVEVEQFGRADREENVTEITAGPGEIVRLDHIDFQIES
jgi:hypothetical protein